MGVFLALTAIAGLTAGAHAQCTPLGATATNAGLTRLVSAIDAAVKNVASPEATSLLTAVQATEEVAAAEKVTVFAPSDAAFGRINSTLEGLSPAEVLNVLLNHVVPQDISASELAEIVTAAEPANAILPTLLGQNLEALMSDGLFLIPQNTSVMAQITTTDVITCAGTVHVIDTVLVPASFAAAGSGDGGATCKSIQQLATEAGLDALLGAVTEVQGLPAAEGFMAAFTAATPVESPVTVFAPTDFAFETIGDVIPTLTPEDLLNVLGNHVVPGEVNSTALLATVTAGFPNPVELDTLIGATLEGSIVDNELFIAPGGTSTIAKVTGTDVRTCAGLVHIIDMVLVPGQEVVPNTIDPADTTSITTPTDTGAVQDDNTSSAFAASAASAVLAVAGGAMLLV